MSRTLLLLGAALAGCASAPPASAPTVLTDRVAAPVERGAAWRLVKAAARRVGADVRYARP